MSLSQEPVLSMLKKDFVVGWKNIKREKYVGASHGYACTDTAVGTTNGAGPGNMQTFILSSDSTVLHCLPGFWHPEDLAHELRIGHELNRLWQDKRSKTKKRAMFKRIHKSAILMQSNDMRARSGWQGFDAKNERDRLKHLKPGQERDTFYYKNGKVGKIKPTSVLVHERMASRPFVKFSRFDTAAFVDYGRKYYDNNGGGVSFGKGDTAGALASKKRMADRRKAREAKKAKVDAYYGKKPKGEKGKAWGQKKDAKPYPSRKQKSERATSRPSKKRKSSARPTSRPTSRPSRR